MYFFFASRRRHTRWPRDWSSDVCSSDLSNRPAGGRLTQLHVKILAMTSAYGCYTGRLLRFYFPPDPRLQIGRASCRERVKTAVGNVSTKIDEADDGPRLRTSREHPPFNV